MHLVYYLTIIIHYITLSLSLYHFSSLIFFRPWAPEGFGLFDIA